MNFVKANLLFIRLIFVDFECANIPQQIKPKVIFCLCEYNAIAVSIFSKILKLLRNTYFASFISCFFINVIAIITERVVPVVV